MDKGFVDKGAVMELAIANGGDVCERGITIREHALSCWSFIETRGGWYDESRWTYGLAFKVGHDELHASMIKASCP